MRLLIFLSMVLVLFSGCNEISISEQKKQCLKEGKRFLTETKLNYRTGEYELKGHCVK